MISWPTTLIREISRRRVVLFLGAGVSASAKDDADNSPLGWGQFLASACDLVRNPDSKRQIEKFIEQRRYLIALDAIYKTANKPDYFHFLDQNFNNAKFKASELHNKILDLDASVVITTNFDKIYEKYCESTSSDGYKVVSYDSSELSDLIRSDTRLIIKAHGSINNIQGMIFTRTQYHEAKRRYPNFYTLLKAVFLTRTCIFIGCSMDDPDILLALEDVKITASSNLPHYAIMKDPVDDYSKDEWLNAYNIEVLKYGPDYSDLIEELDALVQEVEIFRDKNRE